MVWYGCISAMMPSLAMRRATSGPRITCVWMTAKRRSGFGPLVSMTCSIRSSSVSIASSPIAWTRGESPDESAPSRLRSMVPGGSIPEPGPPVAPVFVESRQLPRTPVVR